MPTTQELFNADIELENLVNVFTEVKHTIINKESFEKEEKNSLDVALSDFIIKDFQRRKELENILEDEVEAYLSYFGYDIAKFQKKFEKGKIFFINIENTKEDYNPYHIESVYFRIKSLYSLIDKILLSTHFGQHLRDYCGLTFVVRYKEDAIDIPCIDFKGLLERKNDNELKDTIHGLVHSSGLVNFNPLLKKVSEKHEDFKEIFEEFFDIYMGYFQKFNEKACFVFAKELEKIAEQAGHYIEDLSLVEVPLALKQYKEILNPLTFFEKGPKIGRINFSSQTLYDTVAGNELHSLICSCPNLYVAEKLEKKIRRNLGKISELKKAELKKIANVLYLQYSKDDIPDSEFKYYMYQFENPDRVRSRNKSNSRTLTFGSYDMLPNWFYLDSSVDLDMLSKLAGGLTGILIKFINKYKVRNRYKDLITGTQEGSGEQYRSLHFFIDGREWKIRSPDMDAVAEYFMPSKSLDTFHEEYKDNRWKKFLEIAKKDAATKAKNPKKAAQHMKNLRNHIKRKILDFKIAYLKENIKEAFNVENEKNKDHLRLFPLIYNNITTTEPELQSKFYHSLSEYFSTELGKQEITKEFVALFKSNIQTLIHEFLEFTNHLNLNTRGIYRSKIDGIFIKIFVEGTINLLRSDNELDKVVGYGLSLMRTRWPYEKLKKELKYQISKSSFDQRMNRLDAEIILPPYIHTESMILGQFNRMDNKHFVYQYLPHVLSHMKKLGVDEILKDTVREVLYDKWNDVNRQSSKKRKQKP